MPLNPGDTFFEYRITRSLGRGAFGMVFLAQDTLLERPVAIKELTAAAQADPVAFKRFLQEARTAGSLNHPNIVTVYALKPLQDTMYLVMEYLPGGSLRELLNQRGRLPVNDAVRLAADVCDGLAAAHAKGIVHRDIKPENILLTADGRAKVGDFGIAHVPRSAGGAYAGGLTQAGFQPGTLVYMSPEQIRGEAVDGRSDVYQAGALLYELLTGQCRIDLEAMAREARAIAGTSPTRFYASFYDLLEQFICSPPVLNIPNNCDDIPVWLTHCIESTLDSTLSARPEAQALGRALRFFCPIAQTQTDDWFGTRSTPSSRSPWDQVPARSPQVMMREYNGETLLIDPGLGRVRILNSVGARVWQLIDGHRTIAEIATILTHEYAVSQEQSLADVENFCNDLIGRTLLVWTR